jgi:hypothetical protein
MNSILDARILLDWVERLDAVRILHEATDRSVHTDMLVGNALREVADFIAELREERLAETN